MPLNEFQVEDIKSEDQELIIHLHEYADWHYEMGFSEGKRVAIEMLESSMVDPLHRALLTNVLEQVRNMRAPERVDGKGKAVLSILGR